MTERIEVCPECSTSKIYRRKSAIFETRRSGDTAFVCEVCGENFETPAEREHRGHGNALRGTAKKLSKANPEDYPQ